MKRLWLCLVAAWLTLLAACSTVPGELNPFDRKPVNVGLTKGGPGGPLPVLGAEPLVINFQTLRSGLQQQQSDPAMRAKADGTQGRFTISWALDPSFAGQNRIGVRIAGFLPIGPNDSWQDGVARLSNQLKDQPYCAAPRQPVARCVTTGLTVTCSLPAAQRAVFKYQVLVFGPNDDPETATPQSCLDPWGVIN